MLQLRLAKERYTIVYTDPTGTACTYSTTAKAFAIVFDNTVIEEHSVKTKVHSVVETNSEESYSAKNTIPQRMAQRYLPDRARR